MRYDEILPVMRVTFPMLVPPVPCASGEVFESGYSSLTFEEPDLVRFEDNFVDTSTEFGVGWGPFVVRWGASCRV